MVGGDRSYDVDIIKYAFFSLPALLLLTSSLRLIPKLDESPAANCTN